MSWRGKPGTTPPPGATPGRTFAAPAGFRDSPQPPLPAGEVVFSTYQIRRELARADDGAVIEAWDMMLERGVAMKIAWKDPGAPALLPEARRCASVADDGAVRIYGMGNHKGAEFVAGELISGVTLARHVHAYQQGGGMVPSAEVLELLIHLARAVAAAHRARVAVGEIPGETVLVTPQRRTVLGRFSLSQVPAMGAANVCWAPEVITGQVSAADPQAAAGINLYGLGCAAVELAVGRPPFVGDTVKATLFGHVHHRPPVLGEIRNDLPVELGDLVAELLSKSPQARPPQAESVVEQLVAIADRANATRRIVRVLVVDDDSERVRGVWSTVRRGHPRATVDAARDGGDAANRVRRDHPEVIVIDIGLTGAMNALELCMLIAGLEEARDAIVVAVGDRFDPRDAQVLAQAGVHHTLVRDTQIGPALIEIVRRAASSQRFQRPHGRIADFGLKPERGLRMMRRMRWIVIIIALAGAACGGGSADPGGVYFDVAGPHDTGDTYWNLPFPSDLRLNGDGTIDLTGYPNPRNAPILTSLLSAAALHHGFPEMPVGYFRFRAAPPARDPGTVIAADPSSDAFLVDVSTGPEHGTLYPLVAQTFATDKFAPSYLVAVAPRPGVVLAPSTTYALVLRTSFAPGATTPPDFLDLANGAGDAAAAQVYAPLWPALDALGVAKADVLVATVFTTGDEVALLHARGDALRAAYHVTLDGLHVQPDHGATEDGFCELVGTVTFPQFQTGTQPFETGGVFVLDGNGTPMMQGTMTVPLTITLPLTAMPTAGFPLYQFFHGSGGSSTDVVDLGYSPVPTDMPTPGQGPAWIVAKQGLAAASASLPLDPERLPGAVDTEYLNIDNLAAFPFTFQQGVIEQRLLTDALASATIATTGTGAIDLGACEARGLSGAPYKFDPAKLVAGGQSMGGMYTNMIGAVEPRFGALVPTGAGGDWAMMITKTALVPGALQLLAAAFNTDESQVTFLYPGMHMLTMGWEIADPMVSMSRLERRPLPGTTARNIYEPVGFDDEYFPTDVYDAAALSYGNQEAGTTVWPTMQPALALEHLDGLLGYPVRGNRGATTNVVVQYMGDGIIDPHYIYRQLPAVKHQYACFLRTFLDTGTATVVAPGAIDDPCN